MSSVLNLSRRFPADLHHPSRLQSKPSIFPTHTHGYETVVAVAGGLSAPLFSAITTALSATPGIVVVLPELVCNTHTTHSPQFLSIESSDNSDILAESGFGSDLVIAVIDTGILPERRSFSDDGLGLVLVKWKGACVAGTVFPATACNNKLVADKEAGPEATGGTLDSSGLYHP